jgi:hypothetical protein
MKPLNLDNRPCSPISSNCVVWQGPTLDCISLCTGDTISDVVAKMATELCTLLDQTNVTNYDLTCLGITACGPANFQALIQLLIDKICELNGVTPDNKAATSDCPDCIVTVAECLRNGNETTMQLLDYVQLIASKVCALIDEIAAINIQIQNLDDRVTILENTPPPTFTLPSIPTNCLASYMSGQASATIDLVLNTLLNDPTIGYCALIGATGLPSELLAAVAKACITSSTPTLSNNPVPFGTQYVGSWVNTPTTVADALNNIWIILCDYYAYLSTSGIEVQDTNSIDLDYTGGILTANIVDTGWVDLLGFNWYGTYISDPVTGSKPQCRRIGNIIYFRGTVMIPLQGAGGVPLIYDYYTSVPQTDTYYLNTSVAPSTVGTGSVVVNANGSITFNQGNSVIPTSVLGTGTQIDGRYQSAAGWKIAYRTIPIDTDTSTILTTLFSVVISPTGQLAFGLVRDGEEGILASSNNAWNTSPLQHLISHVTAGQHVPKYDNSGNVFHDSGSAGSAGLLDRKVFYDEALSYPFSCDANNPSQVGGFSLRLDGSHAFVEPCNTDIKPYVCE